MSIYQIILYLKDWLTKQGATFQINFRNIKQGFKRTISWNKYRSEITIQPKNNNLDYLIDPAFRNINRLFVLSFISFKIQKSFFDQPVKNKEASEKLIEISRNDYYTTENLLDFLYHQNYCQLIGIDLWRQTNTNISQQTNFAGRWWCSNVFYC